MSAHTELAVAERSCLLRAARKQLLLLQDEIDRLDRLPLPYAIAPREAAQEEHDCLARAVAWLWLQHRAVAP